MNSVSVQHIWFLLILRFLQRTQEIWQTSLKRLTA
jgi:hypothetical protein